MKILRASGALPEAFNHPAMAGAQIRKGPSIKKERIWPDALSVTHLAWHDPGCFMPPVKSTRSETASLVSKSKRGLGPRKSTAPTWSYWTQLGANHRSIRCSPRSSPPPSHGYRSDTQGAYEKEGMRPNASSVTHLAWHDQRWFMLPVKSARYRACFQNTKGSYAMENP
jgi:hypothetical protein